MADHAESRKHGVPDGSACGNFVAATRVPQGEVCSLFAASYRRLEFQTSSPAVESSFMGTITDLAPRCDRVTHQRIVDGVFAPALQQLIIVEKRHRVSTVRGRPNSRSNDKSLSISAIWGSESRSDQLRDRRPTHFGGSQLLVAAQLEGFLVAAVSGAMASFLSYASSTHSSAVGPAMRRLAISDVGVPL